MTDAKNSTQAETLKKVFGQNLTDLRKQAKMTRGELAEKLNLSVVTVGAYENGVREPNFDKMIELADLFNVSLDKLFGRDNVNSEKDFFQYHYEKAKQIIVLLGLTFLENKSEKDYPAIRIPANNVLEVNENGVIAQSKNSKFNSSDFIFFENKVAFVEFIEQLERKAIIENKSFREIFDDITEKLFADKAAVETGEKLFIKSLFADCQTIERMKD